MRIVKLAGKVVLVLLGTALAALLVSVVVNYRPGAVEGQRLDPGAIEALAGGSVRLPEYAGRVVLIAFSTNS